MQNLRFHFSINKIAVGFLLIFINCFLLLFFPDFTTLYEWCSKVTFFVLFTCVIQLTSLYYVSPKNRMFIYFMIVISYVFHFSHIILTAFGYKVLFEGTSLYALSFSFDDIYTGSLMSAEAIMGMFVGFMLFAIFHNKNSDVIVCINHNTRSPYSKTFCKALIIIGLLSDLVKNTIVFTQTVSGYANLVGTSIPYPLLLLSYMLLPGVLILVTDDTIAKKNKTTVVYMFVIYRVLTMIGGLRAFALLNIFIAVYVYYRRYSIHRIRVKDIITLVVVGQLMGSLLIAIRNTRAEGIDITRVVLSMFDFGSNVLFEMMSEFGITQNVINLTISSLKGVASGGTQLLYSIVSIIPGTRMFFNWDFSSMCLEDVLDLHRYGGSYIADLLFDFGTSGVLWFAVILGLIYASFFETYERSIISNSPKFVVLWSPVIVEMIYCVRSSLTKMPRMICWYLILFFVLHFVFYTKTRNV